MTSHRTEMRDRQDEETRIFSALLGEQGQEKLPRLAEELHQRYHRLIHYLLRIFEIPYDLQPDLFNQIFLRIMKGLGRIKHCGNVKSWVVTITKNEIFNFLSRRERDVRRYTGTDDSITVLSRGEDKLEPLFPPEKEVLGNQLRSAFRESVSGLDDDIRRPFLLRYQEFLKWREIGSQLGLHIDTARKRAEKARRLVLRDLQRTFGKNSLV